MWAPMRSVQPGRATPDAVFAMCREEQVDPCKDTLFAGIANTTIRRRSLALSLPDLACNEKHDARFRCQSLGNHGEELAQ